MADRLPLIPLDEEHEPGDGPPPMAWKAYVPHVEKDLRTLMADQPRNEKAIHEFLERHPTLLSVENRRHDSWPHMIVSKPAMKGFTSRTPDFLSVEEDSARLRSVLIEIETPAKRWATEKGVQHAELTQAIGQTEEWRAWFADSNRSWEFQDYYGLTTREGFEQRYVVIHGSRKEAIRHEGFARARRFKDLKDLELMTFDRLSPDANQSNFVTVRRILEPRRDRPKFELVGIPATFEFDILSPRLCAAVRVNPDAVRAADYMAPERAEFVIRQWKIEAARGRTRRPVLLQDNPE